MFFSSLSLYLLSSTDVLKPDAVSAALSESPFVPCTSLQVQSIGWVSPYGDDRFVAAVRGHMLATACIETKKVPGAAVKRALAEKVELLESQGQQVGRKLMKELKNEIIDELLPKVVPTQSFVNLWLDPVNGWLGLSSTSSARCELVIAFLKECVPGLQITLVETETLPAAGMRLWLATGEPPEGFFLDDECELRMPDDSKATVKYSRHQLDIENVREHLLQGKQPLKLGMSWETGQDTLSFVLDADMRVKRIKAAPENDTESESEQGDPAANVDAQLLIEAAALSNLARDLTDALGGCKKPETAE